MRRGVRFVFALVIAVAVLSAAAYSALIGITRGWFERDLALRARLAVTAAGSSLVRAWHRSENELGEVLGDIARDERVMGAAACSSDGFTVARSPMFPYELGCDLPLPEADAGGIPMSTAELERGPVHVSRVPITLADGARASVLLVHDLSYVARRETTTRRIVLLAFFVLSAAASLTALVLARYAWRGWTLELRRALTGNADQAFKPLLRDVYELAEQIIHEHGREHTPGLWSADRLRATLTEHLHGERVVLLANREPYIHERVAGAAPRVVNPASGLVTALEPVLRACSGVWVAHGSGSGDRDVVDAQDRVRVPPGEESYTIRRVWLSRAEERGYYYGFANEGLWPLCHLAHAGPVFRADDFRHYTQVNRRFAEAVVQEVDTDDPIVLVQDYHFALAPRMIRERLPRATIITFWHIPWPNSERFGICPWRDELLAGLAGSSVIGFHTQQHCNNFLDAVDSFLESRIDREQNAVILSSHRTLVRPYPISIDWPSRWLAGAPSVVDCRAVVRARHGLPPDALIGVGVDRLDYTKGIEERILAVEALLDRHPELVGRFTFIQIAAPSRSEIERYKELGERVRSIVARVNGRFAQASYAPVVLLEAHHAPAQVVEYYRAAELCYVSSLHDGMNLVAKEFLAARDDERGVLVLSQFTGAARELTEALIVNPYDITQASDALVCALRMSREEQAERMRAMRRHLAEFNVYRWAGRMLSDAALLRRRDRLRDRIDLHSAVRRKPMRAS